MRLMRSRLQLVVGGLVTVAATFALSVPAAMAAPPPNDNYLDSHQINSPGQKLDRDSTLRVAPFSTLQATTQTDLFAPKGAGGGAELTRCGVINYGKTVWYDFFPDVTGLVRLQANGYDSLLRVIPYDVRTSKPDWNRSLCSNQQSSSHEEFFVRVKKGAAYTVQVGAVNGVAGNLEFLFDFLADQDNDNVLDSNDDCPKVKGSGRNGCPPRLRGAVTLRAMPTANGIRILGLTVATTRNARVQASCTRRACRKQVVKRSRGTARMRRLTGANLGAGSKLTILVTKKAAIGRWIQYRIVRGNFKKTERCLNPGSRKPRRRCG